MTSVTDAIRNAFAMPGQVANARIIATEFSRAGFSMAVGLAAIVNAYEESRLDHLATWGRIPWRERGLSTAGSEDSAGLFMLNAKGAGRGMTLAERHDPYLNTRRIIAEVRQYGGRLQQAATQGATVAELTAIFCEDIERPSDRYTKGQQRADTARRLFPTFANLSATNPIFTVGNAALTLQSMTTVVPWWAWLGGGAAIFIGLLLFWFPRR